MSKLSKFFIAIILGASMLMTSGCLFLVAGAAAGGAVAGTAYYMGKLKGNMKATPQEIEAATLKAFKKLNINVKSQYSSNNSTEVEGVSTFNGDKIDVYAKLNEGGTSDISIRINTFGDQEESQRIYDEIESNL
ncbi:MAG TPA: hypothetical protein DD381_07510 [Lentisphaeria bacterium]|nr:MAG: hypothetical protein A2X47_04090 [Lentisphaerae bacterium GWF2_38_69]HBM16169.1 hypothetical protein [Lentisphaeria bacterium]